MPKIADKYIHDNNHYHVINRLKSAYFFVVFCGARVPETKDLSPRMVSAIPNVAALCVCDYRVDLLR